MTEIRDLIAYVGQSNFIFSGSIRDNLTLRRSDVPDDAVFAACKTVGLHDHIMKLPKGYDTFVGELGSLISGGQAQRLNIARAIIKDAPILLFDEVTSALDAENEELVREYMHSQAWGGKPSWSSRTGCPPSGRRTRSRWCRTDASKRSARITTSSGATTITAKSPDCS